MCYIPNMHVCMYYMLYSGKGGVEGAKRSASSIDLLGLSTFVKYGSEVCIYTYILYTPTYLIYSDFLQHLNCTNIPYIYYRYYLALSLAGTTP